jgi:hypothetical protein
MNIELSNWYEHPTLDSYYTHKQQAMIPSLGTFYGGLRVPALLLTVFFRIDPKTKKLVHDVKVMFQADGPSDAQLNFKHSGVTHHYSPQDVYIFDVMMDIDFNSATVLSRTIKGGGKIEVGSETTPIRGGVDGSYESGKQYAETVQKLHARIHGTLEPYVQHNRLHVGGSITGDAAQHRDKR